MVVPVEEQYWEMPAFEGVVGMGALRPWRRRYEGRRRDAVCSPWLLKRQGVALKRDVVFCAVPDEEAGSTLG